MIGKTLSKTKTDQLRKARRAQASAKAGTHRHTDTQTRRQSDEVACAMDVH